MELARVMATRRPAATLVFAAVAGEEQGLYGADHMARAVFQAGDVDVQGMFTNDIVGSSTADDGTRDPHSVRLFAEGVPTAETPEEADDPPLGRRRERLPGPPAGPVRHRGRRQRRRPACDVRVIYRRDRYLRGGDHIPFLERGFPAARFTEPNEDYAHQHQDVRVENGKQYGDLPRVLRLRLHRPGGEGQRRHALVAGDGAGHPEERPGSLTAELTNDTELCRGTATPGAAGYEVVWRPTHRGRLDPRDRRR